MLECISDFSCWENSIAKLAPIGTALIALFAALIALGAIFIQMHLARRRASIDFFLKTEIDEKAIDLYDKFRMHAPSMSSIPPVGQRGEYKDVRSWLNICELIAVGVRKRAFSKSVSYDYWGDVIPRNYRTAERLINEIRNSPEEGSAVTYIELEKLAKKWAAKAGVISATQSSWRATTMLERFFASSSKLLRNELVKMAALFWNTTGAGIFVGSLAAGFFLPKPPFWGKVGIAVAGFVGGLVCHLIGSYILRKYWRD